MYLLLLGVVFALASMPRAALAHPPPFYWMGDLSVHSRAGVEIIPGNYDRAGDSAFLMPMSVFAEYALSENVVLLGRLPFTYADRVGIDNPDDGAFALGNIGLGAQLAGASGEPHYGLLLYGIGLMLYAPTASDEDEPGVAAVYSTAFLVPDPGRYLPDATTVRVRGDVRYEAEMVFVQGEVGIDHRFVDDIDDRTDLLLAAGLGLAFNPYWAVLGELTVLSDVFEDEGDTDFVPVLDLGVRYHDPGVMAGLRVYWPFHEVYRDVGAIGLGFDVAWRF